MRDVIAITKRRNTSRVYKAIARPKVSADAQEVRRAQAITLYASGSELFAIVS